MYKLVVLNIRMYLVENNEALLEGKWTLVHDNLEGVPGLEYDDQSHQPINIHTHFILKTQQN